MESPAQEHLFREPKMDHRVSRLWGVSHRLVDWEEDLYQAASNVVSDLNLNIFGDLKWRFQPQGLTLVWGLMTSHMAIHTWPEIAYPPEKRLHPMFPVDRGYMHVDTVVCGGVRLDRLHNILLKRFNPLRIITEPVTLANPHIDHPGGLVTTTREIQDTFNYILPQPPEGKWI